MGLNTRLFRQQVSQRLVKQGGSMVDDAIKKNFEEKKAEFLEAFDDHEVTKELQAASTNPMMGSSFIPKGNLFSLIGFDNGDKPTDGLRNYLNKSIKLNLKQKRLKIENGKIVIETPVQIPTLDDLDKAREVVSATPDWVSGRSWITLLQKGITGFGQFVATLLASPDPSRSGGGLQHKGLNPQLSGSVGPIKYVNQLLAEFKASLKSK